jgi:hypothetical protein
MSHEMEAPAGGGAGERDNSTQSGQTTPPQHSILAAALKLSDLGYAVVPLNAARVPMLKAWPHVSADPRETRYRFQRQDVRGIAVVTRGALVLDLDRGHANGADGIAEFDRLRAGRGVPKGPRVRSRRGGLHLYSRDPGVQLRMAPGALGAGIDIKRGNALVTVPPTAGYSWIAPLVPISELPAIPEWLLELARKPEPTPQAAPAPVRPWIGETSQYAKIALEGELAGAALAKPGERNAALFRAAARLGSLCAAGHLPFGPVARGLLLAADECGLTHDDGHSRVHATIESGLKAGARSPREVPAGGRRHGS